MTHLNGLEQYASFVLGENATLPEEIISFDQKSLPEVSLVARIDALDNWLSQNMSKNYANDQRIIEQVSLLRQLGEQPLEEMNHYLQAEKETTFPLADFMRIDSKESHANEENYLKNRQHQLAVSVDILTYLKARGETFEKTPEGLYQHSELPNLCYDSANKTLTFTLNGDKEVATNPIEAGKLVYGYGEQEAENDIFMYIKKGAIQVGNEPNSNREADLNDHSREEVNKQAKDAYVRYLKGDPFPTVLKTFDQNHGVQEGLLIRMEALDEEIIFGTSFTRDHPVIEEKADNLYAVYRGTPEEQALFVNEEYCTLTPDLDAYMEEEKGRSM